MPNTNERASTPAAVPSAKRAEVEVGVEMRLAISQNLRQMAHDAAEADMRKVSNR